MNNHHTQVLLIRDNNERVDVIGRDPAEYVAGKDLGS
jgi:hypothetical protein